MEAINATSFDEGGDGPRAAFDQNAAQPLSKQGLDDSTGRDNPVVRVKTNVFGARGRRNTRGGDQKAAYAVFGQPIAVAVEPS